MSEGGTPAAPTTIAAAVVSAAARFARREALVDGDTRLDFAELATEARRVAGALVASGIEPGERIAIWAPTSPSGCSPRSVPTTAAQWW